MAKRSTWYASLADELYPYLKVKSLKKAFYTHKSNAKRRGIPFKLTFNDWFLIWYRSGHLTEMGKHAGQYVMARFADKGAYEEGNVAILRAERNHRNMEHTEATKARISKALSGIPQTAAHRRARGIARKRAWDKWRQLHG